MKDIIGFSEEEIFKTATILSKETNRVYIAERLEKIIKIAQNRVNLTIPCVSNLLLCGVCDEETEHEEISSTTVKCLECGNIATE